MIDAQVSLEEYAAELAETAGAAGRRRTLAAIAPEDRAWQSLARDVILQLAGSGREFTADTVRSLATGGPSVGALGAVIKAAAADELIEPVGFAISKRSTRHGGVVRVWRGRRP